MKALTPVADRHVVPVTGRTFALKTDAVFDRHMDQVFRLAFRVHEEIPLLQRDGALFFPLPSFAVWLVFAINSRDLLRSHETQRRPVAWLRAAESFGFFSI